MSRRNIDSKGGNCSHCTRILRHLGCIYTRTQRVAAFASIIDDRVFVKPSFSLQTSIQAPVSKHLQRKSTVMSVVLRSELLTWGETATRMVLGTNVEDQHFEGAIVCAEIRCYHFLACADDVLVLQVGNCPMDSHVPELCLCLGRLCFLERRSKCLVPLLS
jgi:hypothetical protein